MAEFLIKQDYQVVIKQSMIISEQHFIRSADEIDFPAFAIRYPIYNEQNKIVGIFAFAVVIGPNALCKLAEALTMIVSTGLLNLPSNNSIFQLLPGRNIQNIYLSQRESECLKLLVRGKTIKMSAKILGLSPRTVEHYLENVKIKMGVNTKFELIDKILGLEIGDMT